MASQLLGSGDVHTRNMPMYFYIWIIRNQSRTIVVDTGFGERAARERGRALDFDPIDALGRIGVDAGEVKDVILTHLHFDHAGNVDRFPAARFHVQGAEMAFATGPCMCAPFMRAPFDVEDVVAMVKHLYADQVVFHHGDASPFPGISLHVLPGHSAGIQAVRVMTERGPVLLASDVSHYYANFLRGIPFRLTIDVAATHRSYRQLTAIAGAVERIIPGHDPKTAEIYPAVSVNGVELLALHHPPKPRSAEELARI